ncbi:patatin-like phospholipase family protein [Sungkyunkwania multivorans]|uniref:Patatin-like phospholipase family protein n=1 Tax=Sungkyunkwania multivorans TaxID=1173618 RepID=A0ABW3D051_9FLAO
MTISILRILIEKYATKYRISYLHFMNRWLLILTFCIIPLLCFSQQETPQKDVKVGLVLSGGGAKGLAHIGALKVIEKSGVRIDYIGGTSMGAIVGALYASGYTAGQLDSIFRAVDFEKLIQDELPRSAKTFYEKDDDERYALTLPFDRFKLSFPSAISKGQNVYNLLAQLTAHIGEVDDFSKLPIPFLCVATNVETGQPVILEKGYLPQAISASGAFPSLFEPVSIEELYLIDGGVTNNYPINEVKAKGMDYIIGVDVQDALMDRKNLKTAPGILLQINNYRTVEAMKERVKLTDVYIKPDIRDFTVVSFNEAELIVDSGEEGALEKLGDLEHIAGLQRNKYERPKVKVRQELQVDDYIISGNSTYSKAYVKGKIRLQPPAITSYKKFNQGISNLAATGNFQGIRHRLKKVNGKNTLFLDLYEQEVNTYLKLGLHYDNLYKSAALINLTSKRFIFDNDVVSMDFILGDNIRYNFEYYLDSGFYWSFGVKSSYNEFNKQVKFDLMQSLFNVPDQGLNALDLRVSDFTNQLYLQTVIREEFAFGLGIEHKHIDYETETIPAAGSGTFVFDNSDYYSTFGFLKLDTYDNRYFPKQGFFFDGDFHLYLLSSDFRNEFSEFSVGKADIGFATSFGERLSLQLTSSGGFTLGKTDLRSFNFILGGYGNHLVNNFTPFLGYDFLSLAGDSFVKGGIGLDYELFPKHHLNFTANYANVGVDIFGQGEWFTAPDFSGYAVGYGIETLLGPLQVKYSWSPETSSDQWFVSLGFWF